MSGGSLWEEGGDKGRRYPSPRPECQVTVNSFSVPAGIRLLIRHGKKPTVIFCCTGTSRGSVVKKPRRLHNHIKTTILSFPPVARPVEAGGNPVISKLSGCRPPRFRAGMTNKSSFSTLLIFWRCHAWAASRIVKEGILQDGKSAGKS